MRRTRIGISLGYDRASLLAIRGGRVLAAITADFGGDDTLPNVLAALFRDANLPRFPAPHATLVLGPSRAQLREVGGLPESRDPRILAEVVRQDPTRFFLNQGPALAITGVRPVEPGTVWTAGLEDIAVREVHRACTEAAIQLDRAAPLAVALANLRQNGRLVWSDGPVATELEVSAGVPVSSRRWRESGLFADISAPQELANLGATAVGMVESYAAIRLPPNEPLVLSFAAGDIRRWRVGLAGVALAVVLLMGFALPVMRTRAAGRTAATALTRQSARRATAAKESGELLEVSAALSEVAEFSAERRSAVAMIAALARALPTGSALLSVRVDTVGGSLVVLAPRAADVLAVVEQLPGVGDASLTGALTRETIGDRGLERAALRFTWRRVSTR